MFYLKKPIVVAAEQWFPGKAVLGVEDALLKRCGHSPKRGPHVHTDEGPLAVKPGDWIVTGIKGERYPCKPDIFDATYEAVISEPAL